MRGTNVVRAGVGAEQLCRRLGNAAALQQHGQPPRLSQLHGSTRAVGLARAAAAEQRVSDAAVDVYCAHGAVVVIGNVKKLIGPDVDGVDSYLPQVRKRGVGANAVGVARPGTHERCYCRWPSRRVNKNFAHGKVARV